MEFLFNGVDYGLNWKKGRALFVKWSGFFGILDLSFNWKSRGPSPWVCGPRYRCRSTGAMGWVSTPLGRI
jgi:hypothetical protein